MTAESTYSKNLAGFLQLLARFRDEEAEVYDSLASGYDRFAESWNSFARPALEHLFEEASGLVRKKGRILDAGCGTGLRIPQILKAFDPAQVVGVDISESMLNMARRKSFDDRVSLQPGNLLNLPFEDDSFDAVVAIWVVETMGNPGAGVQEFLRLIKPDGVVAYSFVQIFDENDFGMTTSEDFEWKVSEALREAFAPENLPFHYCPNSSLNLFNNGLISTVILKKCCEVSPRILPKPFNEFEEY